MLVVVVVSAGVLAVGRAGGVVVAAAGNRKWKGSEEGEGEVNA